MKIFICEFITGGGLNREKLPTSLAIEGQLMRNALIDDLMVLAQIELITTYDIRLNKPFAKKLASTIPVSAKDDVWQIWRDCINSADLVLPIAPETDGLLERFVQLILAEKKPALISSVAAIKIASSKMRSYRALIQANIPTIHTVTYQQVNSLTFPIIAKRDDGAGCEDSAIFDDAHSLKLWARSRQQTHIFQPFVKGVVASVSLLAKNAKAYVLSCNVQSMQFMPCEGYHEVHLTGLAVNGAHSMKVQFEQLAERVVMAFPGLYGYIGVDVIMTEDDIFVLEVNPRLTSSYIKLHQSIAYNPAKLMLDLHYNENFKLPALQQQQVDFNFHE